MDIVQTSSDDGTSPWSYPKYAFFRENQRSYAALAAHGSGPDNPHRHRARAHRVRRSDHGIPDDARCPRRAGRDFPAEIDIAGGARRVVLISDALWQRRFNADPGVIGQSLSLNNEPWEIAGVLPPGFNGLSGRAEVLVNLSARPAEDLSQPWSLEYSMIGRLKDGVTVEQAIAEARLLGPRIYDAFPMTGGSLTTSKAPTTLDRRCSAAQHHPRGVGPATVAARAVWRRGHGAADRLREPCEPPRRPRHGAQAGNRGAAGVRCGSRATRQAVRHREPGARTARGGGQPACRAGGDPDVERHQSPGNAARAGAQRRRRRRRVRGHPARRERAGLHVRRRRGRRPAVWPGAGVRRYAAGAGWATSRKGVAGRVPDGAWARVVVSSSCPKSRWRSCSWPGRDS